MIEAKIIADSINNGNRLTTFVCKYPRFIHSEALTHRTLSRNSASSRAIPSQKLIDQVLKNPAMPVYWAENQKGMQSGEPLSEQTSYEAERAWRGAATNAAVMATRLMGLKVHKSLVNRVLEPFLQHVCIFSATDWGNFFNLRCHKDAQPEFQVLARKMLEQYVRSTPKELGVGEWHLPFADQYLDENLALEQKIKITVARCARVSYLNFEGDIDHQKDYDLFDRLKESGHMSPFEHAATPMDFKWGNFYGWKQYRQFIPNENRSQFDPKELLNDNAG